MNIILEGADTKTAQMHTNVDRDTTTYRNRQATQEVATGGFTLDISGTVTDNSAYAGHGRTAQEVMLMAGQEDIRARRNYMAVMSNSMSDEDFARLQEEGFHPGSTDIETVVTIVDHIKAALVKGGTNVTGYTDTISDEVLTNITGSQTFARELKKQFATQDIPVTRENVEAVMEGFHILDKVRELSEGAQKYMVENGMEATPENLYLAQFSSSEDTHRQGRGYYATDHVTGYYAKKPEFIDIEQLRPQMTKVIEEAGYASDEENLQAAKWLIETGIPLNTENFCYLKKVTSLEIPVSVKDYIQSAGSAIADGVHPNKAELTKKVSNTQLATWWVEKVETLTQEATDLIMVKNLPLTLRNIVTAQEQLNSYSQEERNHANQMNNPHGNRLLQEIRLSMTVEANLKLLRSGYQIDTTPLEELVIRLKEAESSYQMTLTGEKDAVHAGEKASLYEETMHILAGIKGAPADILAQISQRSSLREISAIGNTQSRVYERAGESYESLMTAPRGDLGDTIRKAFRNVDDILEDMNLEVTAENQKAVRILGYNSMEITQDNISLIRSREELLSSVISQMKPGRVLNMIREGENPVTMPLEDLENYLSEQEDAAQEMESYSKFLYKLEKQKGINKEERSAFVGIYRLIRQLEKNDSAAIGALWQTGAEFTLENLLTANRSNKRKIMDYRVDDSFGGMNAIRTDVIPNLDELIRQLKETDLQQAEEEFNKQVFDEVRAAVRSEDAIQQQLTNYSLPVTADNLAAARSMIQQPREFWNKVIKYGKEADNSDPDSLQTGESNENWVEALVEAGDDVVQSMEEKDSTGQAYESLQSMVSDALEKAAFSEEATSLDVKAMTNLCKQISFMTAMAKEENYEIPVSINGQLTSINLKIVHSDKQDTKVAISFETQSLGKTAAEFKIAGQSLTGFCMSDSGESAELLKENQGKFEQKLNSEEIELGSIYFVTNEKLDLADFSMKESQEQQAKGEAGILYRAARAFIGFTQEMAIMKGSGEYEN